MNWLLQIFSITIFNLRSLPQRAGSAVAAAVGIAGVVAVLTGVLSIREGFRGVMDSGGAKDIGIVLRSGADNEMNSGLSRDEVRVIKDAPGVARGPNGPLASAELFVLVDRAKRTTGTDANVPLRGVEETAFDVRGNVKITSGRRFETGRNEVIVGEGARTAFLGLEPGQSFDLGQTKWEVVGTFTAAGSVAESEIWCDTGVLQPAYKRENSYQSVQARLVSEDSFTEFKDALTSDPRLKVKVQTLSEFFAGQSKYLSDFITTLGVTIAALMAAGALFGALNTMYGAITARTREIATLRALGFSSGPVIISVLAESLVLALAGGAVGAAIAYFVFNGLRTSTMNWQTFSQVTFAFAVTPALLLEAVIWSAAIGFFGGLFPAIRAARLSIATGLRES
jgi:putative ABC transport system permease protein